MTLGVILLALAVLALVFAVVEAVRHDYPWALVLGVVGVLLLAFAGVPR